jgi:hypothetical protein
MIHVTPSRDFNCSDWSNEHDQFASVPGQTHHDMRMRTICEEEMAASRHARDVSNK